MSLTVEKLTGKSELVRLRKLIEGVPKLASYISDKLTSKAWISPTGSLIPLPSSWHWDYFRNNPEVATTYGIEVTDEQGTRMAALAVGFIRVNYERNTGTLTVESGTAGWTRRNKDKA